MVPAAFRNPRGSFFLIPLLLITFTQTVQCSKNTNAISVPDELQEMRELVLELKASEELPSLAVGVARDGEIIWQEGFGQADREKRVETTPNTMYSTASISKPFTATAIKLLAERGEIDLDAPANEYLTGAKLHSPVYDADEVTVRMLLDHTGGLPLHYQFFYEDEEFERPSMAESINRYGVIVYEPGAHYQYANFGYGVLDEIIANASGMTYTEFMEQEVFEPLELSRTYVGIKPGLENDHAIRYGPDHQPIPFYDFDHRGASAVYSSVKDLLRFGMFFTDDLPVDQQPILSEQSRQIMKEPSSDSGSSSYGLGWLSRDHEAGLHEVWHTGSMGGVSTILTMIPEENTVVTVLANMRHPAPARIARQILHELYPDRADNPAESQSRSSGEGTPELPDNLTDRWEGQIITYADTLRTEMEFLENGDIHLKIENQPRTLLDNVRFDGKRISGHFQGSIGTEDAERRPYLLQLDAVVGDDIINGALIAISLPGERLGNALSSYIEFVPE